MEPNILASIQLRDKTLHMYKKSNDYSLWVKYKQLRNKVQHDIKKLSHIIFGQKSMTTSVFLWAYGEH